ncbi:MAG: phosphoglucosamine mutase [Candidatus Omnitrophota bacterium]
MKKNKLFGTDGIRGKVGAIPLTENMVFELGKAVGEYLQGKGKVIIGKDTRYSCDRLEDVFARGLYRGGIKVYSAGIIPTPGLAFLTKEMQMNMGAMISASHNLAEDNGIKFFYQDGFKISDEAEEKIEEIIFKNMQDQENVTKSSPDCVHYLTREEAELNYIEFLKNTVNHLDFHGIKLVIDCANGAAYHVAKRLFTELGLDTIIIHGEPNGKNINLNCGSLHPQHVAESVVYEKADLGFCFDGDADRLIIADEHGTILDGDYIMAMCAIDMHQKKTLTKHTLVTTVMSNFGLEKVMNERGINLLRTNVGDKYVISEMLKGGYTIGGEQSGHIIFLDYATTGDGLITALQVLKLFKESNRRLSEFSKCIVKYPQILLNIKVKQRVPLEELPEVQERINEVVRQLKDEGRVVVRYSGTEPLLRIMLEGKSEEKINKLANAIAETVKQNIGLKR